MSKEGQFDFQSSLRKCMAFSSMDWGQDKRLAWMYGIILGWDDVALKEMAARHFWGDEALARLATLRLAFTKAYPIDIPGAEIAAIRKQAFTEAAELLESNARALIGMGTSPQSNKQDHILDTSLEKHAVQVGRAGMLKLLAKQIRSKE